MTVYCLYHDGSHIGCFHTRKQAEEHSLDLYNYRGIGDIEEEDFEPNCDCKLNFLYLLPIIK